MAATPTANPTSLIAGIASPVLALFTPAIPIALVLSLAASIAAFVMGGQDMMRIQRGELDDAQMPKVIAGLVGGGLGCLMQIVMAAVSAFILVFVMAVMAGS